MSNSGNMTVGNPFSLILKFSLPLIVGNLLQQTYNIVDAAIVGKTLGAEALGSVGASSSIQFLVLGFCIGMTLGFAIPVAREFGAENYIKMRTYIFNSIILNIVGAIVITLICLILCKNILYMLKTPSTLYDNAYKYLFIIFMGIPFNILYNSTSSILRAIGNSKTPFYFLAFSAILNIGLDFYFILSLKLGVSGAAIATILSQGISGFLCLLVILKKYNILKIKKEEAIVNPPIISNLLSNGLPMGLQFSITAIGSMIIQGANNSLGAIYTSAFAASYRIKQLFMSPFDAIGTGASTFISQNIGAKKYDRIKVGLTVGLKIALSYSIISGFILFLLNKTIVLIFVSSEYVDVISAASLYIRWFAYFLWLLGLLIVTRMSLQGLGFSNRAVVAGALEMLSRVFSAIFIIPFLHFFGICISDQLAWLVASIYLIIIFKFSINEVKKQMS